MAALVAGLVVVRADAGQVIAAQQVIEQPAGDAAAAVTESDNVPETVLPTWPTAVELVMIVAAIAVLVLFFRRRWHDLRSRRIRPPAIAPLAGAILFVGFLILSPIGAAAAARAWGIDAAIQPLSLREHVIVLTGAYAAQLGGVIGFFMMRSHTAAGDRARRSLQTLHLIKSTGVGFIALLLTWPIITAVGMMARPIVEVITGRPVDVIAHESLRLFLENPVDGWYIMFAVMVVLAAPVIEEVMYRGVLQSWLVHTGINRWAAIFITSVVFASAHGTVEAHALPVLFVLSLSFGWVYERTSRLAACITMHALFNAANLTLALLTT